MRTSLLPSQSAESPTDEPFPLREITRAPPASPSFDVSSRSLPSSSASSAAMVVLEVHPQARFWCPIYLLARGSRTLRTVVEDLVEADLEEVGRGTVESGSAAAVGESDGDAVVPLSSSGVQMDSGRQRRTVPVPFLDEDTFLTVAMYWEHFYGVGAGRQSQLQDETPNGPSGGNVKSPLGFADLYTLSEREHAFVLHRLVKLPELLAAREQRAVTETTMKTMMTAYARNGAWVDAVGAPLSARGTVLGPKVAATLTSAPPPPPPPQQPQQSKGKKDDSAVGKAGPSTPPATEKESIPFSELVLTASERRTVFERVCTTLEAATRLGTVDLQSLCAAVAANMLVQLDEAEVGRVLGLHLPPFTEDRKRGLLEKYSWATGKEESAAAATTTRAAVPPPAAVAADATPLASTEDLETEMIE